MATNSSSGLIITHGNPSPQYWQRWSVTPYPEFGDSPPLRHKGGGNFPVRLDRLLKRNRFKLPETVLMGGGGEPYPETERKRRITRRCIEVLARHGTPFVLLTNSPLILRDIDLIREAHQGSHVTIGFRLLSGIPGLGSSRETTQSHETALVIDRIRRSGVQTGLVVELTPGQNFTMKKLSLFFRFALDFGLDFLHFPWLGKTPWGHPGENPHAHLAKAVIGMAEEYRIRLRPRRHIPFDLRRESFWLAEQLADKAYQLSLAGQSAAGYWGAARRVNRLKEDLRLYALRGDLSLIASPNPSVMLDMERLLRGERGFTAQGFFAG